MIDRFRVASLVLPVAASPQRDVVGDPVETRRSCRQARPNRESLLPKRSRARRRPGMQSGSNRDGRMSRTGGSCGENLRECVSRLGAHLMRDEIQPEFREGIPEFPRKSRRRVKPIWVNTLLNLSGRWGNDPPDCLIPEQLRWVRVSLAECAERSWDRTTTIDPRQLGGEPE